MKRDLGSTQRNRGAERVPALRFKGFGEEWEKKRFSVFSGDGCADRGAAGGSRQVEGLKKALLERMFV